MHPVIAGLSAERRRVLFACPGSDTLSEDRKVRLLDEVVKVRESLASDDELDAFSDQRMADAAKLKSVLNVALTVLGRPRRIAVDMIDGLTDFHPGGLLHNGMADVRAFETFSRRMLEVIERLEPEPRDDGNDARAVKGARQGFSAGFLRILA
jgi:hypothetical protein